MAKPLALMMRIACLLLLLVGSTTARTAHAQTVPEMPARCRAIIDPHNDFMLFAGPMLDRADSTAHVRGLPRERYLAAITRARLNQKSAVLSGAASLCHLFGITSQPDVAKRLYRTELAFDGIATALSDRSIADDLEEMYALVESGLVSQREYQRFSTYLAEVGRETSASFKRLTDEIVLRPTR